MDEVVEKTLKSDLRILKFVIQPDESTFGNSNILLAYVQYLSLIQRDIIDGFLLVRFLKEDGKGMTIFQCLEEYAD